MYKTMPLEEGVPPEGSWEEYDQWLQRENRSAEGEEVISQEENNIVDFADRQSRGLEYYINYHGENNPYSKISKSSTDVLSGISEADTGTIINRAARQVFDNLVDLLNRTNHNAYYLTMSFGFSNGMWKTVEFPGAIEIAPDFINDDGTTAWARIFKSIVRAISVFWNRLLASYAEAEGLSGWAIGVHSPPERNGGCTTKNQFKMNITFENDEGGTYTVEVMNFRSNNNNCGLICAKQFLKRVCANNKELREPQWPQYTCPRTKKLKDLSYAKIKNQINLTKNSKMNRFHFETLAKKLQIHFVCRDKNWNLLWETNKENHRTCILMNRDEHYLLCRKNPIFKRQKRKRLTCNLCGAANIRKDHRCRGVKRRKVLKEKLNGKLNEKNQTKLTVLLNKLSKREPGHVLLYGAAGTGKSYVIGQIQDIFNEHDTRFVTLSPTGVAATGINGSTIHSYFGLGVMDKSFKKMLRNIEMSRNNINGLEYIMIDECSMLTPKVFLTISELCKRIRCNNKPFGGISIILIGDFLQLPPVNPGNDISFIFETELWQDLQTCGLAVYNLQTNYRFKGDQKWFELLMRVRRGWDAKYGMVSQDMTSLRSREKTMSEIETEVARRGLHPTFIYGRKMLVKQKNKEELASIFGPVTEFPICEGGGVAAEGEWLALAKKNTGQETILQLKVGAEVMCVNNHTTHRGIQNGSRGTVTKFVRREKGVKIITIRYDVEVDFERVGKVVVSYVAVQGMGKRPPFYMPLMLAWAVTAHKCQSRTMNCVVADLEARSSKTKKRQVWEGSQAYVVISRVRRMKNLFIIKGSLSLQSFSVNPRALNFNGWAERWTEKSKPFALQNKDFYLENMLYPEVCSMLDKLTSCLVIQPKKIFPNLLFANTVFYDLETYWDPDMKMERPYFNNLQHYYRGEKILEVSQCAVCLKKEDILDDLFETIKEILISSADRAIKYRENPKALGVKKEPPIHLAAYNGGSFDYHFIMQRVIENEEMSKRFIPHIITKGTRIVRLSFYDTNGERVALRTHDLMNIIPGTSLNNAAKSFLGDNGLSKQVFPHSWVTRENIIKLTPESVVSIPLENFPISERKKLQKSDLDFSKFHFDKVLHEYGKRDVDVMVKLYEKLDKLCDEIVRTSLLRFPSLAKITWYGMLTHIPDKHLQERAPGRKHRLTKIFRTNRQVDKLITRSIQGGKVFPRYTSWRSKDYDKPYSEIQDAYVDLDINSMYPSSMMKDEYPMGLHTIHDFGSDRVRELNAIFTSKCRELINAQEKLFIALADCKPHPKEIEPCIARRNYNSKGQPTGRLIWDNKRRTEWYCSVTLKHLLKNEGTIYSLKRVIEWPEKAKIFAPWVKKTFVERKKAEKEVDGAAKGKFYKTLGNACYGASCQKMYDDVIRHVSTPKQLTEFHYQYDMTETVNMEEVLRKKHSMLILKGKKKVEEEYEYAQRPRYLGSFVLAYTKIPYDETMSIINPWRREGSLRSLNNQILYGDTDSMFVPLRSITALLQAGKIGKKVGQLSDDITKKWYQKDGNHRFAKIIDYVGPGAKSYAVRAVLHPSIREEILEHGVNVHSNVWEFKGKTYELTKNQVIIEISKFKGINRNDMFYDFEGHRYRELTLPMIRKIIRAREEGKEITVVMPKRITRNGIRRSIADKTLGKPLYNISRKDLKRNLLVSKFDVRQRTADPNKTVPNFFSKSALASINKEILQEQKKAK
jgi:hypothetical protein